MTPALLLLSPAAHAAAPDAVTHRVSVETGLGGPLGAAGVAWTVEPAAGLRLETGVGAWFSGAQFSVMPSCAWGSPRRRFAIGAGVSWASDGSVWVNLEAARGEWTSPAGAQFFVAAGASLPSHSGTYLDVSAGAGGTHSDLRLGAMAGVWVVERSTAPWWSNEGSFFRDAEPHVRVGVGYWL